MVWCGRLLQYLWGMVWYHVVSYQRLVSVGDYFPFAWYHVDDFFFVQHGMVWTVFVCMPWYRTDDYCLLGMVSMVNYCLYAMVWYGRLLLV